jgi:hypothetical protein
MRAAIKACAEKRGLSPAPLWVEKAVQLYQIQCAPQPHCRPAVDVGGVLSQAVAARSDACRQQRRRKVFRVAGPCCWLLLMMLLFLSRGWAAARLMDCDT